jgi:hypothetical protein
LLVFEDRGGRFWSAMAPDGTQARYSLPDGGHAARRDAVLYANKVDLAKQSAVPFGSLHYFFSGTFPNACISVRRHFGQRFGPAPPPLTVHSCPHF